MLFPFVQRPPDPTRVVVTGAGVVSPLGCGWERNAAGFREGRAAFKALTVFDASRQRTAMAGEITFPDSLPESRLDARRVARLERAGRALLHAGIEAWTQSGPPSGENVPIVLGTTSGGMTLGEEYYRQAVESPEDDRGQSTRVSGYQAQRQALDLMAALGINGPLNLIANACASGANAVGHAFEMVRSRRANVALAGGYDGLSHLVFAGFDSLQALSTTTCRPFDASRDGLMLGEGAAVLVLENLASASKRGAPILGEVIGYGATTDTHHLTQPQPAGDAALRSMTLACETAALNPADVDYINAHGTGTPLNDSAEAGAINRWAGSAVDAVKVSSTKGSIGHLLGAAGAVEVVVTLMALQGRWVPPSPATRKIDPLCRFDYVTAPMDCDLEHALTNSFGFGGANATVALRRWR